MPTDCDPGQKLAEPHIRPRWMKLLDTKLSLESE